MGKRVVRFWIEKKIIKKGFKNIAGVDEAGRGALFGPVVAAAVIFPSRLFMGRCPEWAKELKDSKLLTPGRREHMAKNILSQALSLGIGLATNSEIDRQNIYRASLLAMKRAVEKMTLKPDFLLVDGFCLNGVHYPQIGLKQGDRKSPTIAAASIIAKVFRDEMMVKLDRIYEGYALSKNKGYGTKEHFRALKERGPSSFHRMSFNLKQRKDVF
jgi:ribonuclease HII